LALTVGLGVAADGLTDEEGLVIGVTGEQGGSRYFVPDALTATRTDTPLEEIPQSIQVIPQEVFEDQGIKMPPATSVGCCKILPMRGDSGL
jgi:iron complex outermembrane receptor protein